MRFDNEVISPHLRTVESFRAAAMQLNPNGIIVNTIVSRLNAEIGKGIH